MYTPKGKETDTISKLPFCSSPLPYLKLQKHTEGPVSRTEIEYKICWLCFQYYMRDFSSSQWACLVKATAKVFTVTFTPPADA